LREITTPVSGSTGPESQMAQGIAYKEYIYLLCRDRGLQIPSSFKEEFSEAFDRIHAVFSDDSPIPALGTKLSKKPILLTIALSNALFNYFDLQGEDALRDELAPQLLLPRATYFSSYTDGDGQLYRSREYDKYVLATECNSIHLFAA
jgi:hypothetical protein